MQAKMLEEEESRFGTHSFAMERQNITESSEDGPNTTFSDLLGDTKQYDVPTFDDLIGEADLSDSKQQQRSLGGNLIEQASLDQKEA